MLSLRIYKKLNLNRLANMLTDPFIPLILIRHLLLGAHCATAGDVRIWEKGLSGSSNIRRSIVRYCSEPEGVYTRMRVLAVQMNTGR